MKAIGLIFYFVIIMTMPLSANAIEFSLFGDTTFKTTNNNTSQTFSLGQLDLLANQEISDSSRVSVELVFEDDGTGFAVDVERFAIHQSVTDSFNIAAGRFHTPIGIWNHNFHHGTLIQDTITRPFFLEFEDGAGGILPTHIVGLVADGSIGDLSYKFAIANSNGINSEGVGSNTQRKTLEVFNNTDPSNKKSYVARISYMPFSQSSAIAAFFMLNHVTETGQFKINDRQTTALLNRGEVLFDQKISGFDFRFSHNQFKVFAEVYNISVEDNQQLAGTAVRPNLSGYSANAGYAQLGYDFGDKLTIAARYETLDYKSNATYFEYLGATAKDRSVLAVNYKLAESHALRMEVSESKSKSLVLDTEYSFQWFFLLL